MKFIRKSIALLLSLSLVLGATGICSFAEATTEQDFKITLLPDKTDFEPGEEINVTASLQNNSSYNLGELVIYTKVSDNNLLQAGVTEINFGDLCCGHTATGTFSLKEDQGLVDFTDKVPLTSGLMRTVLNFVFFISRTFVIIREKFNNTASSFGNLFRPVRKLSLGSVIVSYGGKPVEISFGASYVNMEKGVKGSSDISFDPISYEDGKVNDIDRRLCREWFENNILSDTPAYNFTFGKNTLRDTLSDWTFTTVKKDSEYAKYRNGKYSEISFKSVKYGLEGRTEAVIYEDSATCEWTVYLKNTGNKDSDKITDFYAVDTTLETGNSDLYASLGSSNSPDDFTLFRVTDKGSHKFGCKNGRSSDTYMPYFNINGTDSGVCLGVGWSGQWETVIDNSLSGTSAKVRQETLDAKLLPGEEIRSPLVSLTFYKNTNPMKGFNIFRDWVMNSLLQEDLPETMINVDSFYVSPTRTAEEMLNDLKAIPAERYKDIDNLWIDAGWYCRGESDIWNDRFGVWETTSNRFPGGMKEVSDFAEEHDTGVVLWYEEERLSNTEESKLYTEGKKNSGWILGKDNGSFTTSLVWNFGDPDALEYIEKFISGSIKENGVTVYREDSNFDPLSYWEYGDKNINGGRDGITENHYVQGHYQFLDYLFEDNDDLRFYDACASGGRRLDLEVIRRGVPLWRSDYNCDQTLDDIVEATQAQTYSVSFWLPYTGTYYFTGNDYRSRSTMFQGIQVWVGDMANNTYYDIIKYNPERELMNDNFYPIAYGGNTKDAVTSMQYGNEKKGFAVVYKPSGVTESSFSFRFSGLMQNETYKVYNYDTPGNVSYVKGSELMNNDFSVTFGTGDEAIIIEYSVNTPE